MLTNLRRTGAALIVLSLVLLAPTPAHAGSVTKKDKKGDARSLLDLRKVSMKTQGSKVVATMTTHGAWSDADLYGSLSTIGIDFDLGGGKVRGLGAQSLDSGLSGSICTIRNGQFSKCSDVAVERLSATTIRFTLPRKKIDRGAKTYRWRASSVVYDGYAGCNASFACIDAVPQGRNAWLTWKP